MVEGEGAIRQRGLQWATGKGEMRESVRGTGAGGLVELEGVSILADVG